MLSIEPTADDRQSMFDYALQRVLRDGTLLTEYIGGDPDLLEAFTLLALNFPDPGEELIAKARKAFEDAQ